MGIFGINNLTSEDYYLIYKYVVCLFIVLGSLILRTLEKNKNAVFLRTDRNLLILFSAFVIIFAGTRGIRIGTDTWNYYHFYFLKGTHISNIFDFFNYFKTDFMFEVIMFLTFPFNNFNLFLFLVSLIMTISLYKFVRLFTNNGKSGSSLILFLTFAGSFLFLSTQLNIIRNGLALPFILFGIYFFDQKEHKKCLLFFLIAFLFHRTSFIPFICILLLLVGEKLKLKYFIIVYIVSIGLSYLGFGFDKIWFLAEINNEDVKKLSFSGGTNYRTGFRLDFVLYNTFFIFLFIKFSDLKNRTDILLIKYFILASMIFFLNFNISFSDRIGTYSWIVIPLLLFNTIKNSYPKNKLYISSMLALFYFVLNYMVLFQNGN